MAGNSAEPGRSVTSKVVAILLAFRDGNEHSLTEIAGLACLPVSTAHRLVTELAGWGVLERTEESTFRVGMPIKAMAGRKSPLPAVIESARRILEDLVAVARTGARLGILTDAGIAYIEKRCDYSPVSTFAQTPRLPVHATALGKALLAFCPADMIDGIIGGGLQAYTPHTLTDPDQLRRCLASIRLSRVAISRRELEPGRSEVAVPVFGSGGITVAALGLNVANVRADLPMVSSVLTVAARGLSRELASSGRISCFALITEQHRRHRNGNDETYRPLLPVLSAGALDVGAEFSEVLEEIGLCFDVAHRDLVFVLDLIRELLRQPAGPAGRVRGDEDFVVSPLLEFLVHRLERIWRPDAVIKRNARGLEPPLGCLGHTARHFFVFPFVLAQILPDVRGRHEQGKLCVLIPGQYGLGFLHHFGVRRRLAADDKIPSHLNSFALPSTRERRVLAKL